MGRYEILTERLRAQAAVEWQPQERPGLFKHRDTGAMRYIPPAMPEPPSVSVSKKAVEVHASIGALTHVLKSMAGAFEDAAKKFVEAAQQAHGVVAPETKALSTPQYLSPGSTWRTDTPDAPGWYNACAISTARRKPWLAAQVRAYWDGLCWTPGTTRKEMAGQYKMMKRAPNARPDLAVVWRGEQLKDWV